MPEAAYSPSPPVSWASARHAPCWAVSWISSRARGDPDHGARLRLARLAFGRVSLENAALESRLALLPADELRRDLSRCVQSLPESYREIVLLRDIEVLTIDAIAERLSLTREAVKARLHRARKLMREYLKA